MIRRFIYTLLFLFVSLNTYVSANQKVTLQLRWDNQFQFAGYYAAQWQGFYEKEGLEVTILPAVTAKGILSAVEEVGAGRAQFGIGAADILLARDKGVPLVVLASIFQHSASGFFTKQGVKLDSPADFLKLRVARKVNDLIDVELQTLLKAEGIDPEKVKSYPHQADFEHLRDDKVDVVPGYVISFPFEVKDINLRINTFRPIQYGIDFYGDSLFTNARFIKEDPDLVQRFIKASLKGWDYAMNNREAVAKQITDTLPRAVKRDKPLDFNLFQSEGIVSLMNFPEVEIGHVNPARWERMHDYLKRIGILKNPISIDEFIFNPEKINREKSEARQKFFLITISALLIGFFFVFFWIKLLRSSVTTKTKELLSSNKKLQESEERYRSLIDFSPLPILVTQEEKIVFVNPPMTRLFGLSGKSEIIGSSPYDWIHSNYIETAHQRRYQVLEEGETTELAELLLVGQDGREILVLASTSRIIYNGKPATLSAFQDITERKQAEDLLKKTLEDSLIFKAAITQIPVGVAFADKNLNLNFCNPAGLGMRGGEINDLIEIPKEAYSNWQVLKLDGEPYEIEDLPLVRAIVEEKIIREEFIVKHADGSDHICDATAAPIFDNDHKLISGLVIFPDITERKKIEEALRKSEESFRIVFERSTIGKSLTSPDGKLIKVNQAFCDLVGYSYEEMHQFNFANITHSDDIAESRECIRCLLANEQTSYRMEKRYIHKNGKAIWTDVSATLLKDNDEKPLYFITSIIDISNRKHAEEEKIKLEFQLQQAQKIESIGTLAGGIAHDFNNILFPLIGHTEMLLDDIPEDGSIRESLNQIYSSSLRARDLVQQILAFARQEKNELKLMKMQPIVKEAMKLIRSTIPTTIDITQDLHPNCGPVSADPTQIHQIVMNLVTNAYHALEENSGEIKVGLKEIELGEDDFINPGMSPGLYACLSVADTGMGMNKDVMSRIFDPFFTTKEKGTGMGLSVVHGIVKQMNGDIQVYSEPGKGTEFRIFLPIVKSADEKQTTQTNLLIIGGTERVLLVDDEEAILKMEKQLLERLGYQVTSRNGSIEALEAFSASPDKFDMVITDMAMPNMSGDKLSVELTKIRPDIPVLLCTGFSETMTEERAASLGIKGFLLKPIIMKDLSYKIREVLDNK